jgi:hypothetical protein
VCSGCKASRQRWARGSSLRSSTTRTSPCGTTSSSGTIRCGAPQMHCSPPARARASCAAAGRPGQDGQLEARRAGRDPLQAALAHVRARAVRWAAAQPWASRSLDSKALLNAAGKPTVGVLKRFEAEPVRWAPRCALASPGSHVVPQDLVRLVLRFTDYLTAVRYHAVTRACLVSLALRRVCLTAASARTAASAACPPSGRATWMEPRPPARCRK